MVVWNSRRGNHLGQRYKPTASTGRTYGCKQSNQTVKISCATRAVHIWVRAFAGRQEREGRRTASLPAIAISSVGIVIYRRRPNLAIEASRGARTDIAASKARPDHGPDLSGSPGIQARILSFVVHSCMPAARLTLGCRDDGDHPHRRRTHGQCQKPDRILAHEDLPRLSCLPIIEAASARSTRRLNLSLTATAAVFEECCQSRKLPVSCLPKFCSGSFATGSSQQRVRPCLIRRRKRK